MGDLRPFHPVKLFAGVLVSDERLLGEIEDRLAQAFGPIDHRTALLPFASTDYYAGEMGDLLDRAFFSFERLIDAGALAGIKRRTNGIEAEFHGRDGVARPVNLDPGYIEQAKVVLASTKNFYHRVYLGGSVFAEVTLHFRNNTYQAFPWTYPDYTSKAYQEFFLRLRRIYRAQLKAQSPASREEVSPGP